ncbi:MAG: sigma-70 family RNA polymerase sigma factor [Bryobacteraceae bacterium]|nr:sigma-70 family RNA polymerase sigma factor [Bryobacteraceae bacterium]
MTAPGVRYPGEQAVMSDTDALHGQVVEAYEDAREDVYYYVLTLGVSPAQAQEVAQEVFLRLFTTLRRGEEILNVRGWVFRVAHNVALKMRAKEREYAVLDGDSDRWASRDASPESRAIDNQRQERIRRALEDLSPQQRQCLDLRVSGLRYREIAETVGIGTSTVNEFLRRAIAKLRKAIHE